MDCRTADSLWEQIEMAKDGKELGCRTAAAFMARIDRLLRDVQPAPLPAGLRGNITRALAAASPPPVFPWRTIGLVALGSAGLATVVALLLPDTAAIIRSTDAVRGMAASLDFRGGVMAFARFLQETPPSSLLFALLGISAAVAAAVAAVRDHIFSH